MDKIWCLFSISNLHDQPMNNLCAWWREKPTIEQLSKFMGIQLGELDKTTVAMVKLWCGEHVRFDINDTEFRMEHVPEGAVKGF